MIVYILLIQIAIIALVLGALVKFIRKKTSKKESYNALYDSVAAPLQGVNFQISPKPIIWPESMYTFPQTGSVKGSSWNTLSKSLKTSGVKSLNTSYLAFAEQRNNICSSYDGAIAPRAPQDCPNSSFSYMTDLSKYIPGAKWGGCIQLGNIDYPYCYSDDKGKYHVWQGKLKASPLN